MGHLGDFRWSTIQKPGIRAKRLDLLGIYFAHIMQLNLGMNTVSREKN